MEPLHDESYVRSITTMGDVRKVVTNQAIFTRNRIKLVEAGTKVDSSMFDRLVQHKLIPRIDQCLTVEGGITQDSLREYAENLLDNDPAMYLLQRAAPYRTRVLRAISGIHLTPALAFKLTVAHCQRPEVFDHSIRVALVAVYIGLKAYFLAEKELIDLAAAGIFHDIGILHVSPELLKPGRTLDKSERHHLYAHPITAYLILRDFPEYHPAVSKTVFEHHERLDGSGYPRGLKNGEISQAAQILMLAEVANTVFEHSPVSRNLSRFSVLLRLNHHKFNRKLSNELIALIQEMAGDQPRTEEETGALASVELLEARLHHVTGIFCDWIDMAAEVKAVLAHESECPLLLLLDGRIRGLIRVLQDTGFDLDEPTSFVAILKDDPEALVELSILLEETYWQLHEIIHEAHRRTRELAESGKAILPKMRDWLARNEEKLIEKPTGQVASMSQEQRE